MGNFSGIIRRMNALAEFLDHFHIDVSRQSQRQTLADLSHAFSRIPYENITKIIRRAEAGSDEKARRTPDEVVNDHIHWGAGGTCFSLTSTLRTMVRDLGWEAEYLLADRRYGQDTHSALLIRVDGTPHLLDPGFLLTKPVPLTMDGTKEIASGGERLLLTPDATGARISLSTVRSDRSVYRLTYKTAPVDDGEFEKAWNASFQWEMMRYPLLARVADSRRSYLRGLMLQVSDVDSVQLRKIPVDELVARITGEFGLHPAVVMRALSLLQMNEIKKEGE